MLKAAKARLRHVQSPDAAYNAFLERRGTARAHRGAPEPEATPLGASWSLPDGSPAAASASSAPAAPAASAEDDRPEAAGEGAPAPAYRSVKLAVEGWVPSGCKITVDINGEPSVLAPQGRGPPVARMERRYNIAPPGSAAPEHAASSSKEQENGGSCS